MVGVGLGVKGYYYERVDVGLGVKGLLLGAGRCLGNEKKVVFIPSMIGVDNSFGVEGSSDNNEDEDDENNEDKVVHSFHHGYMMLFTFLQSAHTLNIFRQNQVTSVFIIIII